MTAALDDLRASFAGIERALRFIDEAAADLVRNVGLFLSQPGEENAIVKPLADTSRDPLPALSGQCHRGQRGGRQRRAARRGDQPDLRQPARAHRAHRADGRARYRFPADQAGRLPPRQRRLSPARRQEAPAAAVRLGGAEAHDQGGGDPHRAARRDAGPHLHPVARPRADPARRQSRAVRRPRALLPAQPVRPRLRPSLQGAGRFRRHHRALARERPRLRPPHCLDRRNAR